MIPTSSLQQVTNGLAVRMAVLALLCADRG